MVEHITPNFLKAVFHKFYFLEYLDQFNQCKSNLNLYGKGKRGFIQESLIDLFTLNNYGSHTDMKVQTMDFCGHNHSEWSGFWIHHLNTVVPKGLNTKKPAA